MICSHVSPCALDGNQTKAVNRHRVYAAEFKILIDPPLYDLSSLQYNDGVNRLPMRPSFVCAILVAVAVATYAGALRGAFQYDDFYTILINPHLTGWDTFFGHLDHMVRPLLYATFLLDRSLYGNSPSGYHLLNLLLHLGSGLLVYRLLTRAVTEETRHLPFWTAAVFLLHPIQTETVTYISGRASGLMAFFYLVAFFLYSKASEHSDAVMRRRGYLAGSVVAFILSLGSKETAATFPLVLLLWDLLIRRLRGPSLRTAICFHHVPFWIVLLFAAGWAWSHPRYTALAQFSLGIRPFWENLLSESHATAYALTLFFAPWNQNFDHDLPIFHSLAQWPLPLDILALSITAGAGLLSWRRFPLVAFGIGWFVLQMLPTAIIPRNDLLSERNLYLASVGVLLVLVFLGSQFTRRLVTAFRHPRLLPIVAGTIALALICCFCVFTYQRNALYRDPVLLWSDTVEKSPQKARPHNNLGHAYLLRDDWERAIEEFRIAVQLDPDYALAQRNLRDAYLHQVGRQ